jgi:hypothetical protein
MGREQLLISGCSLPRLRHQSAISSASCKHLFVTAQGHARTQYRRAIERKNLMGAEMLLREMGAVDLLEALDYVALLAELRPAKAPRAAVRWHAGSRPRLRC